MSDTYLRKSWNQRLFTVLWLWVSFRTLLPWLVFFRLTFEGDSYSWGTNYFGHMFYSSGLARPDFLLVYALLAAGLIILYLLHGFRFRIGGLLLLLFLGISAADAVYQLVAGDPQIFRGDTLDVTVDLTIVFFVLQFGMFAVALAWWGGVRRGVENAQPRALTAKRKIIVWACAVFVPIQLVLLIFGEPHGLTDEIGVIGTMLQWVLLAYAFYPGSDYHRAVA
jgi:hypothetical protein